jgi:protein-tyrosine phosphatase
MTGAEVYYFEGMGDAEMLPRLTIEGTDTILVEMPFAQWTKEVCRDIEHIIRKQKLRVVLAHVERYDEFQKDRSAWDEVFSLPLIPQINTGSFIKKKTGLFRTDKERKFAMQFLKTHPDMILGSDCHNLDSRPPDLGRAREVVRKKLGTDVLTRADRCAAALLLGTKP